MDMNTIHIFEPTPWMATGKNMHYYASRLKQVGYLLRICTNTAFPGIWGILISYKANTH
jgi:hypothetical protein